MERGKKMNAVPSRIMKRLYTVEEAGMYLGRSDWSVRRLIWDGLLPQVKVGRRVQVDIQDLDEFIEHNKEQLAA
jgi:excisionase family DNA binding protein